MQRQSNNFRPQFTDEECITVYLWGISQRRFEQKAIYSYTKNHLLEWFPKLPSYQAFSARLSRLAPAFQALAESWLSVIGVNLEEQLEYIVDSCPVILAKGPRSGHAKIASELCEKSYNSSRKEWYYGIKLHAIVARRPGHLPVPVSLMASGAAQHDLPAAKQIVDDHAALKPGRLYADKAYIDASWAQSLKQNHALELLTPRKKHKGDVLVSGDTFSTFVSSVRQPIECFFNWLNQLTDIQTASMVRSLSGLLCHIFGRIAAALTRLLFNS
ncbi:MAG: transposase [Bacteroidales bacterium]|jgi:hypothetical protein